MPLLIRPSSTAKHTKNQDAGFRYQDTENRFFNTESRNNTPLNLESPILCTQTNL